MPRKKKSPGSRPGLGVIRLLDHRKIKPQKDWEQEFLSNCAKDRTAGDTWSRLDQAGFGNVSKQLLWEYANFECFFPEVSSGLRQGVHNLEALRRANKVAEERQHGPRADLFLQRAMDAANTAARTQWPFRNANVKTYKDAVSQYPVIDNMRVSRKANDNLRRFGPKIMLAILQAAARNRSIELAANALVALAECAKPNRDRCLDGRSLRRFLQQPAISSAGKDYARLVELEMKRHRSLQS